MRVTSICFPVLHSLSIFTTLIITFFNSYNLRLAWNSSPFQQIKKFQNLTLPIFIISQSFRLAAAITSVPKSSNCSNHESSAPSVRSLLFTRSPYVSCLPTPCRVYSLSHSALLLACQRSRPQGSALPSSSEPSHLYGCKREEKSKRMSIRKSTIRVLLGGLAVDGAI